MTVEFPPCAPLASLAKGPVMVVDIDGRVLDAAGWGRADVPDRLDETDVIRRMARSSQPSPGRLLIGGVPRRVHGFRWPGPRPCVVLRVELETSSNFVVLNERIAMLRSQEASTRAALVRAIEAEAEKATMVEELRHSNDQLEQYAAMVAHDLRAPIRTAKLLAETSIEVARNGDLELADDLGARLIGALGRLDAIVLRLLEYSGLDAQRLDIVEFSCGQLVGEVITDLAATLSDAGVEPEIRVAGFAVADRSLLMVALREFISNAIKYRSPERPPRISVDFVGGGEGAALVVTDNGIGIAPDARRRAFEMFSRLNADGPDGLGFGLTYSQRIIEVHGGTIELGEGIDGQGTSVRVGIPRMVIP